jgi:hypothetical protein
MSLILSLRSKPPAVFDLYGSCCTYGGPLPPQRAQERRKLGTPVLGAQVGLAAWHGRGLSLRSATLWLCVAIALLPFLSLAAWGQSTGSSAPLGELFASVPGAPAVAQPAGSGMVVSSGSELSAGVAAATLKLARGGQVRICPQSNLNIHATAQGLMLGVGAGAIEIDYRVAQAGSDLLVTPDFNVRLVGPYTYHFALGVNSRGDTCFKPLAGNTAGVLLSELLGTDSFGTASNEAMVFAGGKLAGRASLSEECGCPVAPAAPVLKAEGQAAFVREHKKEDEVPAPALPVSRDVTAPLPPAKPGDARVVVDTPFVFSGQEAAATRPNSVARLQFSSLPNVFFLQEDPQPVVLVEKPAEVSAKESKKEPVPQKKEEPKKESKGFMARIKGFFGSLFHR